MAANLQTKFAAGGRGSTLRHHRHRHQLQLNQMMARRGVHLALHPAWILWFPHGLALLDDCRSLMGRRLPCGAGSRGAWRDAAVGLGLLLGAIVMDRILLLSWVLLGDRMEQLCTFLLVSIQEIQTFPLEFQPEWWMQADHHLLGPVYIGSPSDGFWGGASKYQVRIDLYQVFSTAVSLSDSAALSSQRMSFFLKAFVSIELFVINKLIYLEPWRHIVFLVGCEVCEGLGLLRWSYRRALWPWGGSGARLTGLLRCDHRGRLLLCLLLFFLYLQWRCTGSAFPRLSRPTRNHLFPFAFVAPLACHDFTCRSDL